MTCPLTAPGKKGDRQMCLRISNATLVLFDLLVLSMLVPPAAKALRTGTGVEAPAAAGDCLALARHGTCDLFQFHDTAAQQCYICMRGCCPATS